MGIPYDPLKIVGQRSGRLKIILHDHDEYHKNYKGHLRVVHYVKCQCDCGNTVVIRYSDFQSPKGTKSCGCLLGDKIRERCTTHGLWKHPLYTNIYGKMKDRCYNPNHKQYADYGGRGIYICDEWYTPGVPGNPGFVAFYNWSMENGYQIIKGKGGRNTLSIDRIDNDGPYAPWNCRWVTFKVQENNKRNTPYIEDIGGLKITYSEFDEKYGFRAGHTHKRKRANWSNAAIVFEALHREISIRKNPHNGRYYDRDGRLLLIPSLKLQRKFYKGDEHGTKI